jgi:hypothetical protein
MSDLFINRFSAFVLLLTALLGVEQAVAEESANLLSEHGIEQVTENLTHDPSGRVVRSVTERRSQSKRDSDGTIIVISSRTDQRRSKAGIMAVTGHSQTVTRTRQDGTRITVVSTRSPDGDMVPTTRTTTTRDQDGSALTIAEKRGGDGTWVTASESSTVNTHVSGIKIPQVRKTDSINYGPQK